MTSAEDRNLPAPTCTPYASRAASAAAAVASLPAMTPQRLRKLAALAGGPGVAEVRRAASGALAAGWESIWDVIRRGGPATVALAAAALSEPVAAGDAARLALRWTACSRGVDVSISTARYQAAGVEVHILGSPGYPAMLQDDPEPPAVLFTRGRPIRPAPSVAIVGTRSATHYGMDVAAELGAGLAAEGVAVVSGLAAGIDAAAHEGALVVPSSGRSPGAPIAVSGSGLDIAYPAATRRIRSRIEQVGTIVSEAPLGAAPEPWRFPLRNRIIAGLTSVVVVVESHRAGGSLHTVEAALARGREVMAVPGSIRSPASEGTNSLIAAGAQVVTSVADVLEALERSGVPVTVAGARQVVEVSEADEHGPEAPFERSVLAAVDVTPTPTQTILARVDGGLSAVALALERLAEAGLVADCGGAWVRRGRRGSR